MMGTHEKFDDNIKKYPSPKDGDGLDICHETAALTKILRRYFSVYNYTHTTIECQATLYIANA